jgi:hypothetical protein
MRRMACIILGPFLTGCYRFGTLTAFLLFSNRPNVNVARKGYARARYGCEDVQDFGLGQPWFMQPKLVPVVVQTGRRPQASDRNVRF